MARTAQVLSKDQLSSHSAKPDTGSSWSRDGESNGVHEPNHVNSMSRIHRQSGIFPANSESYRFPDEWPHEWPSHDEFLADVGSESQDSFVIPHTSTQLHPPFYGWDNGWQLASEKSITLSNTVHRYTCLIEGQELDLSLPSPALETLKIQGSTHSKSSARVSSLTSSSPFISLGSSRDASCGLPDGTPSQNYLRDFSASQPVTHERCGDFMSMHSPLRVFEENRRIQVRTQSIIQEGDEHGSDNNVYMAGNAVVYSSIRGI
jgi:hypothetical protein